MKRLLILVGFLVFSLVIALPLKGSAAPSEEEVNTYLKEIGWTKEDLTNYLSFYEVKLADFEDIAHLREELGTPINEENLHDMLERYELTKEELEILLSKVGEKVQDYTFLEDLELAVDFYLTHEEEIARAENFFVSMGFKEKEAHKIFEHILSLPKEILAEELERLEGMLQEEPTSVQQIFTLWTDFMDAFQVDADLHVNDSDQTKVSQQELMQPGWLEGKEVHLDLYSNDGTHLASTVMDEKAVSPSYVKETGQELVHLGRVGVKMSDKLYENRMPETAPMTK